MSQPRIISDREQNLELSLPLYVGFRGLHVSRGHEKVGSCVKDNRETLMYGNDIFIDLSIIHSPMYIVNKAFKFNFPCRL